MVRPKETSREVYRRGNSGEGEVVMREGTLLKHWVEAQRVCKEARTRGKPRFPTGITFIDEATGGILPGEVWIIAGRTGSGKTSLAINFAQSIADNPENKVLFLSLEMQGWELALRMYCEMMGVEYLQLTKGSLPMDPKNVKAFQDYIKTINFEIEEYGYRFGEVEKAIKKHYQDSKPDVIFLDYIQLIEWQSFGDERVALSEFSRKLAELAKKLNIAVVVVSQLRRPPAGANMNRPPENSDLKGSGSLEQDAHRIIFIYQTIEGKEPPKHFLFLAKNRGGPTLTRRVVFDGKYYRFKDIETDPEVDATLSTFGGSVE